MAGERQDLRLALQRLAFRQMGYFTAAQARELGLSYQAQKYHVDHGNWLRIDRGLFRLPDWLPSREDTYVRWSLWSGGRGVVSHETALSVHDLGDASPRLVHLTVPPGFRSQDKAVALHIATLPGHDIEDRGAWSVTTPERTLVDVAAGRTGQEQLEQAVADALQQGATTPRRLRRRADDREDRAALRIERALTAMASR